MNKYLLYILNIFNKGWHVSFLILLPFIQKDFHLSLIEIGFLSLTLTAISIVTSFFAGHINDKIGNKNVILISILCYALAWLGFSFASSSIWLYIIYGLGGVSIGLFDPIANAIIAKIAQDHRRGTEIGDFASIGDIGRVGLTTVTTLLVGYYSFKFTVILFAVLSLFFGIMYLAFQKNQKSIHTKDEKLVGLNPLQLFKFRSYLYSLQANICDVFSSSSLFIFIPFLLVPKGIDIKNTGFFTALFFLGYFLGRMILGRFADKHGKAKVLIISKICMAVLIVGLIYMNHYWLIMLNLFLLGIFTRGTSPIIKAMVADSLEKRNFEKGYSLYSSVSRTSQALSRPSYAFIGSIFGINSIFFLSGFVALLTIIPSVRFYKDRQTISK